MKKYILHIDTSGNDGIVYLAADGELLHSVTNTEQRNHAATINNMIEEVMASVGIKMTDLSAIAVVGGPGSYTGLRIGLATAKGLCYALDIPLMMHNKLNLLAMQQIREHRDSFKYYAAIFPARAKEYYMAVLDNQGKEVVAPQHIEEGNMTDLLKGLLPAPILMTGNCGEMIEIMQQQLQCTYTENEKISMSIHALLAFEDFNCNRFVSLYHIEPFYLKAPFTYTKL